MRIQLAQWISWQEYRHIVYVFNEHTKHVYLFADSARVFWIAIVANSNIAACISSLCAEYGNELEGVIRTDLLSFITEIENYGLIQSFEGNNHGKL